MLIGIGFLAGLLIGSVGIGGVIVVPALSYFLHVDMQSAIAAALMGFGLSGLIGTIRYAQAGAIRWHAASILMLAAIPASVAGTLMAHKMSTLLLKSFVGVVVLLAGLHAIFGRVKLDVAPATALSATRLTIIGAFTAVASVLTGTGGPLLLMPILIWQQQSVLSSIGLSQVIQLPISIVSTVTNLEAGKIDIGHGTTLALALAVGCWFGASFAQHVPIKILRTIIAYLLVTIGIAMMADVATAVRL